MNCRTAWLLGVLVVFVPGCNAKLTVVPKNVAMVEGDVAIMNCTTNNDYRLLWRIINNETHANATLSTIYTGNKFAKNYSEFCEISISTKGQFTLKVRTRKEIPLHYVCEEPSVENSGADLVVLEANPVCAVVEDGRDLYSSVQMRCRVHFVGNWIPVMEWKMISAAGTESTIDIGSINTTTTNNVVISTINIAANSSLDGCKYTCTTRFTQFSRAPKYADQFSGRITWSVANNIPEYSFAWMSETLLIVTESNVSWIKLYKDSSMSRSIPMIIIPIIVAMCVVGGSFLLIRFIIKRQRLYWISKVTPKPRIAEGTEQNGDHVENGNTEVLTVENHIIHDETVSSHQENGQAATITATDPLPTIPDVVEECGNGTETKNSSGAAAKLRSKLGYVEMRGIKKPEPNQHQGKTRSEYVTMDPMKKSSGPPKPPRASQLDQPSDSPKTDRPQTVCTPPKKPPRVSQSDATEYVEMNIARAYAAGVAPPSNNPMYSLVEVYASIDHNATVPSPPSKLS